MGIINLESHNQALLMKFLDKFFNKKDIPWVNLVWEKHYRGGRLPGTVKKGSFWWRDVIKLLQKYKDMVSIKVNNGSSCLFWLDSWDSTILKDSYPQAFSFAKNKNISVYNVMNAENITELFQLPLSQIAFDQCYEIETRLNSLPWDQNIQDQWKLGMSSTSTFKSATAYKALMGHQTIEPTFKWTWKSFCQPKHKVFFWLLLHDRLNTRNILRRKQMQLQSFNCEICLSHREETLLHLFWECPFAKDCWGLFNLETVEQGSTTANILALKNQLNSQFFMVMIILLCWTIWKSRNNLIFNNIDVNLQNCKAILVKEIRLIALRVKQSQGANFEQWLQLIL